MHAFHPKPEMRIFFFNGKRQEPLLHLVSVSDLIRYSSGMPPRPIHGNNELVKMMTALAYPLLNQEGRIYGIEAHKRN